MQDVNWVALLIFIALFGFITWLGFAAAHWRKGDLDLPVTGEDVAKLQEMLAQFGDLTSVPGKGYSYQNQSGRAGVERPAGVAVPARQAYSHSASVGKRYTRPARFSAGSVDNFRQKATASSQETCSTGWSGPPPSSRVKCAGFFFMTCSYWAWVTSVAPR